MKRYRRLNPCADILCHCPADPTGHEPGTGGCAFVVKAGRYGPDPLPGTGAQEYDPGSASAGAVGSCPDCGRSPVLLRMVTVTGTYPPDETNPWPRPRKGENSIPLGRVPALAAHRVPGRGRATCAGGKVPAELTYTPPRSIQEWAQQYGPEYVDLGRAVLELPAQRVASEAS